MKKEYVWIVRTTSESGDESGPFAFKTKPTKDQLKKIILNTGEELDAGGEGDFGSFVDLIIHKISVFE